jgi:deferrochelatase/peroxidase EfeB
MLEPLIMGLARHLLTAAGGALVTYGYMDASQGQALSGALLTLVGVGFSVWDKKRRTAGK